MTDHCHSDVKSVNEDQLVEGARFQIIADPTAGRLFEEAIPEDDCKGPDCAIALYRVGQSEGAWADTLGLVVTLTGDTTDLYSQYGTLYGAEIEVPRGALEDPFVWVKPGNLGHLNNEKEK